ncbi:MAG: ABC transporter ATP-binding protein, partial [Desulfatitalea sp.]|nr:ABC transporter ATP-binding protein/permease [Desulfatitalea sp.]NNK00148.1 ABC transporter ATP-binding protein [Desulfatitalea sp.]
EEGHQTDVRDTRLLRRLLPFLAPYRRLLAGSVLLVLALTLLELALPYFSKIAVDRHILPHRNGSTDQSMVAGEVVSQRRLCVDMHDAAKAAVVLRHSDLFMVRSDGTCIAFDDLSRLPRSDLLILRQSDFTGLAGLVLVYVALVMADFGITFVQRIIMERAGHRVMHDLRMRLFDHLQQQSMAFFSKHPTARLVTRVTNDVQNMHELFTTFVSSVVKDLFLLAGIAIAFALLDWRLSLAVFAVLPLVVWAAARFSVRARNVFRNLRIKVAEINTHTAETIEGIRTIQTFVRERYNFERFNRLNQENYRLGMQEIHVFALFMPMIEVLALVALAVLILYGGQRVMSTHLTLGDLVLALSYVRMFFRPIRELAQNYNVLQNALASSERIFGLLDLDSRLPRVDGRPAAFSPPAADVGRLRLDKVCFAYTPGEWILQDVSFDISQGTTLAVVGPTGAGKTSLLNLIQRFYDPGSGAIRFDGLDLRQWDLRQLRAGIALVTQEPVLFSTTVRRNIFSDSARVDDATVARIVAAANLGDLMARLPQGLDTHLKKGGAGLSSGERQLITIARALARNARLILLDEATSYIDSQTESAVHAALKHLIAGRTCLLVAHRLSTARMADRILVFKDGRVAESGSHEQLIAQNGLYTRLHRQDRAGQV